MNRALLGSPGTLQDRVVVVKQPTQRMTAGPDRIQKLYKSRIVLTHGLVKDHVLESSGSVGLSTEEVFTVVVMFQIDPLFF